jgi:ATP-dependent protease Clp ATPase subunit
VLDRCASVLDALDAALADDGAAVTSGEARARATGLRALRAELEQVMADVVGGLNPRRVA